MKLRAPAVPLVTVDPYFSIWSLSDKLNEGTTCHWTGSPNPIVAIANIDGEDYLFAGRAEDIGARPMKLMEQTGLHVDALSTAYQFRGGNIELAAVFTTPLLLHDLRLFSRPVSYLRVQVKSLDGKEHSVSIRICVTEAVCLNKAGEQPVTTQSVKIPEGLRGARIGSAKQDILNRCGDDVRIDWGYFYLAAGPEGQVSEFSFVAQKKNQTGLCAEECMIAGDTPQDKLFLLAYDDVYSMVYFGERLKAYWKKDGDTIEQVLREAYFDYKTRFRQCNEFSKRLAADAEKCGNEKYAELLSLAYRQVVAAHKLVLDENGNLLFISKECFSNGCAATVDVTYPSIPMFLLYNPELVKAMLRPIFKFEQNPAWHYDFAPHDVGCYPFVNGQLYGMDSINNQMPVEECGNMLLTVAAVCVAQKDASYAERHWAVLKKWVDYLTENGLDPANQLCTDDFAGHLPHNCNLSIKAIMAIAGFSILCSLSGKAQEEKYYREIAKRMADQWAEMASNGDGSYRLAFNKPYTFSLKYNLVWDIVFGTGIFPKSLVASETASYINSHLNQYGVPLDSRESYTKSDWMLYCAAMAENRTDFTKLSDSVWQAYNDMPSRVPMTDWYDTLTARQKGFQHRSVQGGLFMNLLKSSGICRYFTEK